jgi:hypothetical protein
MTFRSIICISRGLAVLTIALAVAFAGSAQAQTAQPAPAGSQDAADLAKQLSNPIASLVSVPFQFNWALPVGPEGDTRFILNVQPVMPFSVSENWNMIARLIVPFVGQPPLAEGGVAASGIGDALTSIFFSPKSGPVIWGVGPVLSLPSTSQKTLGTGKWSAGPTFVVLKQQGKFTYGALVNQVWSFGGNETRSDVNQFFLQPFLAYVTPTAVTISVNSEAVFNWEADSGRRATIPINLAVSKVATFGVFPASYQLGTGFYVKTPDGRPDWQLRFALTLLLPKRQ